MTIDEIMMERMADSFSLMNEEEKQNWSYDAATNWITDEKLYAQNNHQEALPFDVEDVYDTLKAMIETD